MASATSTSASLLVCLHVHSDAAEVCKQPMCNHLKYKKGHRVICYKSHGMHLQNPIVQHLHLNYLQSALSTMTVWIACLLMSATASKVKV